jgi:hypothetical protein
MFAGKYQIVGLEECNMFYPWSDQDYSVYDNHKSVERVGCFDFGPSIIFLVQAQHNPIFE